MEEVPDVDAGNAIAIVDAPPAAPSPPTSKHKRPSPRERPVSVFDFLVNGETPNATPHATPNASRVSLEGSNESMIMVQNAPKIFENGHAHGRPEKHEEDSYDKLGYAYGEDPISVPAERPRIEYITPGPKYRQNESQDSLYYMGDSEKKSTDKKRKRGHVEELDLTAARPNSQEPDALMADAPPTILHSGLTGGLNRLLSKSQYPPSPEYTNEEPSPPSPAKRSKHTAVKEKDRAISRGRNGALVKVRKRRTSDESRPRKQQRSHHSPDDFESERPKRKVIEEKPKRKAIEYHTPHTDDSQQQLVVFKSRAELFMSFVTKGPDSEQGYSVHKALKRYHREREEQGLGLGKGDEEKELFKNLRLKRNDRGEIVLFS